MDSFALVCAHHRFYKLAQLYKRSGPSGRHWALGRLIAPLVCWLEQWWRNSSALDFGNVDCNQQPRRWRRLSCDVNAGGCVQQTGLLRCLNTLCCRLASSTLQQWVCSEAAAVQDWRPLQVCVCVCVCVSVCVCARAWACALRCAEHRLRLQRTRGRGSSHLYPIGFSLHTVPVPYINSTVLLFCALQSQCKRATLSCSRCPGTVPTTTQYVCLYAFPVSLKLRLLA